MMYDQDTLMALYDEDVDWRLHYAKPGDVGLDLPVKIDGSKVLPEDFSHFIKPNGDESDSTPWLEVPPGGFAELEVGIKVKLPDNAWGMVTGRSSTAWKKRLITIQGIIDSQYTGYLRTLIYNPNNVSKRIYEGDRLSQLIIVPKYDLKSIEQVDELPDTERAESGFGSTGI